MSIETTRVAGVSFRQKSVAKVQVGTEVMLVSDPNNEYDPNAVQVRIKESDEQIGFIPKERARFFKRLVESGKVKQACIDKVGRSRPKAPIGCVLKVLVTD